jgi:hypothetical protein
LKLIEFMIAPSSDVEGCECIFPDSAFFGEDGKPIFVARSDGRGKMVAVTHRLGLQEIRQKFSAQVRERKKEVKPFLVKLLEDESKALAAAANT